jgi:hypothetical protein
VGDFAAGAVGGDKSGRAKLPSHRVENGNALEIQQLLEGNGASG